MRAGLAGRAGLAWHAAIAKNAGFQVRTDVKVVLT